MLSFIYLCRKFDVLKMQKDDLVFSKKACVRLMGIGVPMGLQCSITAIGSVIMQWAVNMLAVPPWPPSPLPAKRRTC